mmetsp:Transcript_53465/g.124528  ORF Transcript_53465/g.124528 Transcript_53465/m.124528 type:complete len:355 (+) Transcript_53465:29-1093(+)
MERPQPPALVDLENCADYEREAQKCLPTSSWDYISGGEEDTIQRNVEAFKDFMLRPRILRDVSTVSTECTIFGQRCATPIYLSSLAKGGLVAAAGEATFVKAATRLSTQFIVPSISSVPLKEVWLAAAQPDLAFQFYLLGDEETSMERLQEAVTLGASSIIVTVDANAPRRGALFRSTAGATGVFPSPRLSWARLAELRAGLPPGMPVYLKGVQTAEDALAAASVGVAGIIVSNHGGRVCGDSIAALHALEEVAAALRQAGCLSSAGGRVELYFDSGVRSGRDVLKALCLGAQAVGIGRPYYWAAACHGEDGVVALVEMLTAELQHAMAQSGAAALDMLGPSSLCRRMPAPARL